MISRMGLESDVSVANALIDIYCKCGNLDFALQLFDKIPERDVASWTSMICGYSHRGMLKQSLILFERMKSEGFTQNHRNAEAMELFRDVLVMGLKPNSVTVAGLLPAYGCTGSLHRGKQLDGLIYRMGLDINIFTATALIDMYLKCGSVKEARNVFDQIAIKNVASWNAMIGCYGKHGMVDASIRLFERIEGEGWVETYELVKAMPMEVTDSIAGAFFNGCRIHGRSDLAKEMVEMILAMELKRPGGFVTLSNIYTADGEWERVENVRKALKEKGVHKNLVLVGLR
ncbi:hypothetical protein HHK36_017413 [Tetracentron sinense]|uniref:Pentatricopeptide repeat-containing protein n=1 Tax=Tetracentron sinense TaxID=13715 RepID=A0A834YYT9_TETSI|nr:hypothetical protein HHK36_017413 [Tetracentron sinense]